MNKLREDGQWAVDLDDNAEVIDALQEMMSEHKAGVNYKKNYYTRDTGDQDFELIVNAVHTLYPDGDVTVARMARALELLITSGKIQPKDKEEAEPLEAPAVDTTPRDRNGKPLTQAQLDWSEMTRFANESSMDTIRQRKNIDPKFRSFMETNMRRELQEQRVGDGVTPEGQVTVARNTNPAQSLLDFASKYAKEPVANLRPKGGFITLAGEQMPWSTYQAWITAATAAGAIR